MGIKLDSKHIFTDRVDLAWKSFYDARKRRYEANLKTYRGIMRLTGRLKSKEKASVESQTDNYNNFSDGINATIIQYPHAASVFSPARISLWYIVQGLTRRRKSPVMAIQLNLEDDGEKSTVEWMAWGDGKNCIADICLSDGFVRPESGKLENVVAQLPHLFATDPNVVTSYTDLPPLEYVARLERELGVFIGSTPLEDFLATCTKVKETEFATVYKSERLG